MVSSGMIPARGRWEVGGEGGKGPVSALAAIDGRLVWSAGTALFLADSREPSRAPLRLQCPSWVRSLAAGRLDTGELELLPRPPSAPSPVFAVGCQNGTVRLHCLLTGRCIYPMNNVEKSAVVGVSVSGTTLVSLTAKGRLCLRSLGHSAAVLAELVLGVQAFQLHHHPHSQRLLVCSPEQVCVVGVRAGSLRLESVLGLEKGREVRRAELSPDATLLALLYEDGGLHLRCLLGHRVVADIRSPVPSSRLRHFTLSPFADALYSLDEAGRFCLHSLDGESSVLLQLPPDEDGVCLAATSASLIVGLRDGGIVWQGWRAGVPDLLFLSAMTSRALGKSALARLPGPLEARLLFGHWPEDST